MIEFQILEFESRLWNLLKYGYDIGSILLRLIELEMWNKLATFRTLVLKISAFHSSRLTRSIFSVYILIYCNDSTNYCNGIRTDCLTYFLRHIIEKCFNFNDRNVPNFSKIHWHSYESLFWSQHTKCIVILKI